MKLIPPWSAMPATLRADSERLLQRAPRWLEVVCAAPLVIFAFTLFYGVAMYLRFHHYYGRNFREKSLDWSVSGIEALIGVALLGLAINLLRGASRRSDGGLFSPTALRTWGVLFALFPLVLILVDRSAILHFHLFFLCWSAAIACMALAAKRGSARNHEDSPRPIE